MRYNSFEYTREKIIVTVVINKQPKHIVFDTGAPLLISNDLMVANNNPIAGSATVTDAGGKTIEQKIVKVPNLTLGNVSFKNGMAVVFDRKKIGILDCFDIDGIIGSTILKHCVVQIDVDKKIIILTDKVSKVDLKNAFKSKMKLDENSRPLIKLDFGQQDDLTTLFDSGSDKFLPLSTEGYKKLATVFIRYLRVLKFLFHIWRTILYPIVSFYLTFSNHTRTYSFHV